LQVTLLMFSRYMQPPSSTLKMEAVCTSETSATVGNIAYNDKVQQPKNIININIYFVIKSRTYIRKTKNAFKVRVLICGVYENIVTCTLVYDRC
jgi:hypothetical protein